MGGKTILCLLVLSSILLLHSAAPVASLQMRASDCLREWNIRENTRKMGVDRLMSKGPEAALATLSKAQLDLIRTYIIARENLNFRCSHFTPPPRQNPLR